MQDMILSFLCTELPIKDVKPIAVKDINTKREIVFCYEGTLDIKDTETVLQIAFDADFPASKPLFFLKEPYALGFIPHVETDGYICYVHDEGLILNQDDPTGVLEACFSKAVQTLTDGLTKKNINDFYNEFEAYWSRLKGAFPLISFVEITSYAKKIKIAYSKELASLVIADTQEEIVDGFNRFFGKHATMKQYSNPGIYIPLRSPILPPAPDSLWDPKMLRQIIFNNVSSSNKKRLKELIKRKTVSTATEELIVLSIPLPNGNYALAGIEFRNFAPLPQRRSKIFPHPLNKVGCKFQMTPAAVQRYDKDFVLPRAGATLSLVDKNILLIGCGSVGGHIAFELARAGVTDFTLIDKDFLSIENIHRHALGVDRLYSKIKGDDIGSCKKVYKVKSLKSELEAKYPFVTVKAIEKPIQQLIRDSAVDFSNFDLIIIALGEPTLELFLNRHFHRLNNCPPVIFTWLEAFGIGGHALLTKNNKKNGCLECLFHDPNDFTATLYNRASFAAPGQFFGKSITGCGSVFTPYGSMDALQTALLATRLAVNTLLKKEKDNPLLSWKGECSLFMEEGFYLSPRYELSAEELYEKRYKYKLEQCRICNVEGITDDSK
jgi:molybdopterin/thiamine biosynthesis adenylyltransferase